MTLASLKTAFTAWQEDRASRMGAAIAYYAVFSLAPLLVVTLGIVSVVYGGDAARAALLARIEPTLGSATSELIGNLLVTARGTGPAAIVIGTLVTLFGSIGIFGQLKAACNDIWEIPARTGIVQTIVQDGLLLLLVLGVGALAVGSLLLGSALDQIGLILPAPAFVLQILNASAGLGVVTLLFAILFRFLTDRHPAWKAVWPSAFVSAVLFTAGTWALGLYVSRAGVGSAYGAAGSLAVLLTWMYYVAQIFFYGVELTKVLSQPVTPPSPSEPSGAPARRPSPLGYTLAAAALLFTAGRAGTKKKGSD